MYLHSLLDYHEYLYYNEGRIKTKTQVLLTPTSRIVARMKSGQHIRRSNHPTSREAEG